MAKNNLQIEKILPGEDDEDQAPATPSEDEGSADDVAGAAPSPSPGQSFLAGGGTKISGPAGLLLPPQPLSDGDATRQLMDRYNMLKNKPQTSGATSNVSDLINKLTGSGSLDSLKAAQDKASTTRMNSELGIAANTIGAALGGPNGKLQTDAYQSMLKNADEPVKDVQNQQAMQGEQLKQAELGNKLSDELEKSDPTHPISVAARELARQASKQAGLNIDIPDNVSAQQLEKMMPGIEKMAERKLSLEQNKILRGQQADEKLNKRFTTLNQKITAALGNSRSAFGKAAINAQAVDNAQALLNGEVDPNNLDTRQVYELARVIDRVLSQGQPTEASTGHLTPDTSRMWLAKKMEYMTNERQGAGAGDFVNNMAKTLDREKQQAEEQIYKTQREVLGTETDLAQKNPDKWKEMLSMHNIPTNFLDRKDLRSGTKNGGKGAGGTTLGANEVIRTAKDGKQYVYDATTKQPLREYGQ